jgi:elongation factor Ts
MRAATLLAPRARAACARARTACPPRAAAAAAALSTAPAAASVPTALVKQLREMTAAPMMDCRNALAAEGNDVAKAVDWLRKKGVATASKKAGRAAAQGVVACATNAAGDAGVLVEVRPAAPPTVASIAAHAHGGHQRGLLPRARLSRALTPAAARRLRLPPPPPPPAPLQVNSETDFVARNEQFQALAARIAQAALAGGLPAGGPTHASPTGCAAVGDAEFAAWREATALPGGDSLGAACSVGGGVVELVGRIRENLVARRAAKLAVPGGLVVSYTHNAVSPGMGAIGVLVALAPRDAAAAPLAPGATPGYGALVDAARKVAMHVAAAQPAYFARATVPPGALEREREVLTQQAAGSGKPAAIVAKMVDGRLGKFYAECVLTEQPFILADDGVRVSAWVDAAAKAAGAPAVQIAGFAHFVLGQGVALGGEDS